VSLSDAATMSPAALPFTGSGDLETELAIASILLGLGLVSRNWGLLGGR
jgi:hypothetical protein